MCPHPPTHTHPTPVFHSHWVALCCPPLATILYYIDPVSNPLGSQLILWVHLLVQPKLTALCQARSENTKQTEISTLMVFIF